MAAGDPQTRIKQYWPITKQQLMAVSKKKLNILFPEDHEHKRKLRNQPFSLDEINDVFKFNSPFRPDGFYFDPAEIPQRTFGIPLDNDSQYLEKYIVHLKVLQKKLQDNIEENRKREVDKWIKSRPYGAPSGYGGSSTRFSGPPEDLMQQAMQTGYFSLEQLESIRFLLQVDVCEKAISQNIIAFSDFKRMDADKIMKLAQFILGNQDIIDAIQNKVFTIQDFLEISSQVIPKLGTAIGHHASCMDALKEGRTTIRALGKLAEDDPQTFWQAVNSNNYPPPDNSSKCNIM